MNNYFNNDAEVAVLSIILKNPERIFEVDSLKSFMFSSTPNVELFSEFVNLRDTVNSTPEFNLVVNYLSSKNKLDSVGGIDYLKYLYNLNFEVINLKEFIKIVVNSYKARSLVALSSKIPSLLSNGDADVDNAINLVRSGLDNLSLTSGGETTYSIRDITSNAIQRILEQANKEKKYSFSTTLKGLDGITGGFNPGDLWVIAGRPGMGKSAFLCNSILSGVPSLVFSLEMSKEILVYRLLSIKTGIPVFNIRFGILNQKEFDIISEASKGIRELPIFIDSTFFTDIGYVASTIKKYRKLHGIELIHLDYIQLLAERTMESTHELGRITREFKLLSNDLGITSVLYSQLNRLVELREDKRPVLSDFRQSGNIEEDADIGMFLYRDIMYNKDTKDKDLLELLIRKHRNGPTGMIPVYFQDDTNRIYER